MVGIVQFLAGWAVIGAMLWGMSKFEPTRIILYWLLWISIVWLLIINADGLSSLIDGVFGTHSKVGSEANVPQSPVITPQSQTTKKG